MTEYLIGETHRPGRIEVVCGSMFSGKTEELIRRMKRAKFAKQKVEIFKPSLDTRYSEEDVVSHDKNTIRSTPIDSSGAILLLASDIDVVGIDEAQFFDDGLVEVCNQLANIWCTSHRGRTRHGLQGNSLRTHTCPVRHCRRSDKGARHLCQVRCIGLCEPPTYPQQQACAAWRERRI